MDMTEFEEYKKMQTEIENNIMARLHPTLQALLEGQEDINKKLDPLVKIYNNVQTFGKVYEWTVKHFFHLVLAVEALAGAFIAIKEALKK